MTRNFFLGGFALPPPPLRDDDPPSSIARIGLAGTGFHAGRGYVVTCAHVLSLATGSDWWSEDQPSVKSLDEVRVALAWSASGPAEFRVTSLVAWYPPRAVSARPRDGL